MIIKDKWSDNDFNDMGWHDSRLYNIKFPDEEYSFTLYLDYIFEWVKTVDNKFNFWVSPCKLVFENVINLKVNLCFENSIGIDINSIHREKIGLTPNGKLEEWKYTIETDRGNIELLATGFEMSLMHQPILSDSQCLEEYNR